MSVFISMLLTVISGVLVFLIGQIFNNLWLVPLKNYQELKAEISDNLIFYARDYLNLKQANALTEEEKIKNIQIMDELRRLSCKVGGFTERLTFFKLGIPSKNELNIAQEHLMRISNNMHELDKFDMLGAPIERNRESIKIICSSMKLNCSLVNKL